MTERYFQTAMNFNEDDARELSQELERDSRRYPLPLSQKGGI